MKKLILSLFLILFKFTIISSDFRGTSIIENEKEEIALYFWDSTYFGFTNFGDKLSEKLVERVLGKPIKTTHTVFTPNQKKFLAIGSIIHSARNNDIIWGAGIDGKYLGKENYNFFSLDVRAVRGPLTQKFLTKLGIICPEIYGDPALLIPRFFPEFKKSEHPSKEYIIIPHFSDESFFLNSPNVVSVKEDWDQVIRKILDSRFVISTSLHGIVIAEAFGIPARLLRISDKEPLFKYKDYYYGTNRPDFTYASTVQEALEMGGEKPFQCDLEKLYDAFPFDYWPGSQPYESGPNFEENIHEFVLETKKIEVPGYPHAFNPSIIRYEENLLLCFRIRRPNKIIATDQIGFMWLDEECNPVSEPMILERRFTDPHYYSWIQDPKLIKVKDKYYLIYSNILENELEEIIRRIFITEIFYEGKKFYINQPDCFLDFDNNSKPQEKNWVPFDYNNTLMLAYSIAPHKIVQPLLGTSRCETVFFTDTAHQWEWGDLKGGTQASLIDNVYLSFFHSCKYMATSHSNGTRMMHYFIGAYTFEPNPPFKILKISAMPIVGKNFYQPHCYKTWKPLHVVFPGNYVLDRNNEFIWLSYGRQDHEIWMVKINKTGLLQSLVEMELSEKIGNGEPEYNHSVIHDKKT